MRKNVFGRRLKRDTNERKALFKGLMSSLVLKESIKTTEEKAKAIKGSFDKLITRAKKGGNLARILSPSLTDEALKKLVNEIAPRFKERTSGYTKMAKLGRRFSDNASMVIVTLSETAAIVPAIIPPKKNKGEKNKKELPSDQVKEKPKRTIKKALKLKVKPAKIKK